MRPATAGCAPIVCSISPQSAADEAEGRVTATRKDDTAAGGSAGCIASAVCRLHVVDSSLLPLLPLLQLQTRHPRCICLPIAAGADLEAGTREAEGFHDAVEQGGPGSLHSVSLLHYEDAPEELPGGKQA